MLLELGANTGTFFKRNIFLDESSDDFLSKIDHIKLKYNHTDIYRTIYSYADLSEESLLYGPMYFDFDTNIQTEDDYAKIKFDLINVITYLELYLKIPKDMLYIYFSGSKGFHLLIDPIILGIEPCIDLHIKYKSFANILKRFTLYNTLDTQIYDRKRLFRFNNSINSKTNLYKIQLSLQEVLESTFESIKVLSLRPKDEIIINPYLIKTAKFTFESLLYEEEKKQEKIALSNRYHSDFVNIKMLPCVQRALDLGCSKGNRNNTAIAIASSLFQMKKDFDEVRDILLIWNELNNPLLSTKEITSVVKSASIMNKNDKKFGCTRFKDMNLCMESCVLTHN